jgi:hypothetical protein
VMSTEQLRVGDAERDEVASALHEHFAQGRLARDELDERLSAALSARTVGDLRQVTRDLPATTSVTAALSPGADADPVGHPRWARPPWEMGAAHWGPGAPWWPHPAALGWGPRRGRPFGLFFIPAFMIAALVIVTSGGGWAIVPLFAFGWLTMAFAGLRRARRWHHPAARRR